MRRNTRRGYTVKGPHITQHNRSEQIGSAVAYQKVI